MLLLIWIEFEIVWKAFEVSMISQLFCCLESRESFHSNSFNLLYMLTMLTTTTYDCDENWTKFDVYLFTIESSNHCNFNVQRTFLTKSKINFYWNWRNSQNLNATISFWPDFWFKNYERKQLTWMCKLCPWQDQQSEETDDESQFELFSLIHSTWLTSSIEVARTYSKTIPDISRHFETCVNFKDLFVFQIVSIFFCPLYMLNKINERLEDDD